MLVLSRKSERIIIGENIAITIVRIGPNSVRIGIEAPKTMNVVREELANLSSKQAPAAQATETPVAESEAASPS